jgi:hypothetical protein
MVARALVEVVVVVHFAVLLFLVVGGFVAWRWKQVFYAHLAMATWGLLVVAFPIACPLTFAENYLRDRSGLPRLEAGFIDTYVDGVLYPDSAAVGVQLLVASVVLVSWCGVWLRWRGERRTRDSGSRAHGVGAH